MKIRRSHIIIASVILLGLIFMTLGIHFLSEHPRYFAHSLRTAQEADSVAGYPIEDPSQKTADFWTAEFQPNLSRLSAIERFRLPTARFFKRPEGPTAAGHGLVLYTGQPQGYPGKAVLLGHRLADGKIIQSFYAGLSEIFVQVGERVACDERLGALTQELYLEIREGAGIDIHFEEINGHLHNSSKERAANRLDLDEFFLSHPSPPNLPDAFSIMRRKQVAQRSSIENVQINSQTPSQLAPQADQKSE
jgi:hypothetical protein